MRENNKIENLNLIDKFCVTEIIHEKDAQKLKEIITQNFVNYINEMELLKNPHSNIKYVLQTN